MGRYNKIQLKGTHCTMTAVRSKDPSSEVFLAHPLSYCSNHLSTAVRSDAIQINLRALLNVLFSSDNIVQHADFIGMSCKLMKPGLVLDVLHEAIGRKGDC